MPPYHYLEHTADTGIAATGDTLEEAFATAGDALAGLLCERSAVNETERIGLEVSATDPESLLVEWLNEINFLFETEHFAFHRFEVHDLSDTSLRASGYGEPLDPPRHQPGEQVKSATYHGLEIGNRGGKWMLQVILDV